MSRRLIVVVDYGVGNLASVVGAVHRAGHRALVSRDPATMASADLLILPGVGAFPVAMQSLRDHNLIDVLRSVANAGQPLLGICLGMQLLADRSLENGSVEGLGLISGSVDPSPVGLRHIGWNRLNVRPAADWFSEFDGEFVYFNHSYFFNAQETDRLATTEYDGEVVAAVQRGRIIGVQFHPEKSQRVGDRLMARLIEHLTS